MNSDDPYQNVPVSNLGTPGARGRSERGCFFYGCLFSVIGLLVMIGGGGLKGGLAVGETDAEAEAMEDVERAVIQHEPRHDGVEMRGVERDLIGPGRMRADETLVKAAELDDRAESAGAAAKPAAAPASAAVPEPVVIGSVADLQARLAQIVGAGRIDVNTAHQEAVVSVPSDMTISARMPATMGSRIASGEAPSSCSSAAFASSSVRPRRAMTRSSVTS